MHRWYQVVFGSGQGGLHRVLVVAGVVVVVVNERIVMKWRKKTIRAVKSNFQIKREITVT